MPHFSIATILFGCITNMQIFFINTPVLSLERIVVAFLEHMRVICDTE